MPRKNPFGSSYVEKRGGVFYFRLTFPPHVAGLVGRRGVRLSLRTAYRLTAHHRAAAMLNTVCRIIAPLNGHKGTAMEQLRAHLDNELREMVEAWTDHHLGKKRPMERDEIDETEELYSLLRSESMEAKASGDWRRWSDRAAAFIERRGLDLKPDSDDFRRLCMELGEVETRFFDVIQSRLLGDYGPHPALPATASTQVSQPTYAPRSGPATGMPAEKAAMSLSEAMEHYFQFKINGGAWKDPQRARNNDYGPPVRAFIKRLDDKAIGALVRSDVLDYFDWMTGRTDIGATTQKLQMERVGAFLRHLKAKLQYPEDLSDALAMAKPPKAKSYERFEPDELRALFESEAYADMGFTKSFQFWLPMVCLYTGARIEEPASILLKDVKEIDGTLAFYLSGDGNEGGKNEAAPRWVPVHPELIKAGFSDYVAQVRKEGHEFLFPDIYDHPQHGRTHEPSNYFTEYRRSVGVGKQKGEGKSTKTAHSFRSTIVSALAEADVSEDIRKRIVGHAASDVHGKVYNQAELWRKRVAAIHSLTFGLTHAPFRDSPRFRQMRERGRERSQSDKE